MRTLKRLLLAGGAAAALLAGCGGGDVSPNAGEVRLVNATLDTLDLYADSDRLSRLIAELLDVARIDTGRLQLYPRPSDAAVLVRRVVDSVDAGTSRPIELDALPAYSRSQVQAGIEAQSRSDAEAIVANLDQFVQPEPTPTPTPSPSPSATPSAPRTAAQAPVVSSGLADLQPGGRP